ncbi:MAG: hypothetical protein QXQ38_05880 [Archaeoglobaceae archaeon]
MKRKKNYKKSGIKSRKVNSEIREEKCGDLIESGLKPSTESYKDGMPSSENKSADRVSEVGCQEPIVPKENIVLLLPRMQKGAQNGLNTIHIVIEPERENFWAYRFDTNRIAKYFPFIPADQLIPFYKGKLEELPKWMYSDSANGSLQHEKKRPDDSGH